MSYLDGVRENVVAMLSDADENALAAIIKILDGHRKPHGGGTPARSTASPSNLTLLPLADQSTRSDEGHLAPDFSSSTVAPTSTEARPTVASNLFGPSGSSQPTSARGAGHGHVVPGIGVNVVQASMPGSGPLSVDGNHMASVTEVPDLGGDDGSTPAAGPQRNGTYRRGGRRIAVSSGPSVSVEQVKNFKPRVIEKSDEEKELCRRGVAACHLFSSMDEDDQTVIVDAMAKEEFTAAHDVLKQGHVTTSRFYLIAEGTTNVIKSGKVVTSLAEGSTFGELEMMYDTAECAATIRTVTPCVMFTLDRETYKNMVVHISIAKRELYVGLLKQVSFLSVMTDYDRNQLADALTPATFQPGDFIINFGERGEWMHFILEGLVEVIGRDKGKKVSIVKLGKGEIVGELEFLFDHLTIADVVATNKVKTAKLNRKHFEMCMGPITDELKRFVAKGKYEHYLKVIDSSVHKQIKALEQKQEAKRVAGAGQQQTALGVVDRDGEIIVQAVYDVKDAPERSVGRGGQSAGPTALYRFPLIPVHEADLVMIGVREDGTIVFWNEVIARITNYTADEAIGQSFYSFLHRMKEQKQVNEAIQNALGWVGNIDGFFGSVVGLGDRQKSEANVPASARSAGQDSNGGKGGDGARFDESPSSPEMEESETVKELRLKNQARTAFKRITQTYTFSRSDGLSKSQVQLAIMPSLVAQTGEVPNVLICVGKEVKGRSALMDHTQWLRDQLKQAAATYEALAPVAPTSPAGQSSPTEAGPALAQTLKSLLEKYDNLTKYGSEDNNVKRVNVRQMIMQVESSLNADALTSGSTIHTSISEELSANILCDAVVLPEVLRYALSNCVKHCKQARIDVRVTLATEMGIDYLEVEFEDTGPGIPEKVLQAFHNPTGAAMAIAGTMIRVKQAVTKLGGSMKVRSQPNHTVETFRFPFVPCEEDEDDEEAEEAAAKGALEGDMSVSMASHGSDQSTTVSGAYKPGAAKKKAKHHFTTLVVEERVIHRNMLSAFLWERKHAVLPATNWSDVERLIESSEIVIIDPQQRIIGSNVDIISYLRQQLTKRAIIITGETFDDETKAAYDKSGFLTLTKPSTMVQAISAFKRAEEAAMKHIVALEAIKQTREAFTKTNRGKIVRGQLLGKGAFGEVYECTDVLTGGRMAVKSIRKQANVNVAELKNEIETMCTLHHKNIIHYFYCEEEETSLNVYMEFAAGGTLQGLLAKQPGGKGLERKELIRVVREVCEGVKYVHDSGFVHCDLKTANVLLSADGTCKIGDFGTAKRPGPDGKLHVMEGTPLYMSPECMSADEENGFDFKTDIWSVGWIVFELALGKPPYSNVPGLTPTGLMKHITTMCDSPDLSPLFDDPPLFEFVRACLDVRPEVRPTAGKLLEFNLLSGAEDGEGGALKALKKAQLLHILERFVAFQEPVDEKEAEIEARLKALADRGGKKKSYGGAAAGDFFDSDNDEASDAGGFFDTSDEDEDDEDEKPKKKTPAAAAGGGGGSRVATVPSRSGEDDDDDEPRTRNTSLHPPRQDSQSTTGGSLSATTTTTAATVTSGAAPLPSALKPHPPTSPAAASGARVPTPPKSPSAVPAAAPPGGTTDALERSALNDTEANRDSAVIALHDALWNLLRAVKERCNIDIASFKNPIEEQYAQMRRESRPAGDSPEASAKAPAGGVAVASDGPRFRPNVTEVIRRDTELTTRLSHELLAVQVAATPAA